MSEQVNYCPLCGSEVAIEAVLIDSYDCPNCGTFQLEVWQHDPFTHS